MPSAFNNAELPPAASGRLGRWILAGALFGALLLVGVYNDTVFEVLTTGIHRLMAALGLYQPHAQTQPGVDANVTQRYLPAGLVYAGLYLGVCLALLWLLLPTPGQWRLVLRLYAGALAVYAVLVLLGKFTGNTVWLYRLARNLLDFVMSPLPVAGLYVLFRAGFGPAAQPHKNDPTL